MRRLRLLLASLSFLAVVLSPGLASADVNNFSITNFKSDQTLSRADPQGELHIIEHINLTFTDYNHGIFRAIPDRYKGHNLQVHINGVTSESGAAANYTSSTDNSNILLKIGSPSRTVTGPQEYTIDYTVRNVIGFYKDHDELYWDVNGDQWQQSFSHVQVDLHLPQGLKQTRDPVCFAGSYGVNTTACTISTTGQMISAQTTQPLMADQTLTYVAGFQPGYFHPSKWYETLGEYWQVVGGILVPTIVLGGAAWWRWRRYGRDGKGTGIIVAQYDAPDNLKPVAIGSLMDFKVNSRDMTATIIDLAIRGYIKIIETKKDRLIGKDKLEYTLQLQKYDTSLEDNEKLLLNALFASHLHGSEYDLSTKSSALYSVLTSTNKAVKKQLIEQGYFSGAMSGKQGLTNGILYLLVVLTTFIITWALFGIWMVAGATIGLIISAIFWFFNDARTAKGVAAKEHAEGLKLYLNVAEKDRLEKLQGPDAQYATNANEPKKTVELFEKLLPYAIVLGVESQWAKQFESLYTTPPNWYGGNWTTFNSIYLVSSLNSGLNSAVNTSFSPPSSSGSSGFGGGGFSGGGGGGGGGGGW